MKPDRLFAFSSQLLSDYQLWLPSCSRQNMRPLVTGVKQFKSAASAVWFQICEVFEEIFILWHSRNKTLIRNWCSPHWQTTVRPADVSSQLGCPSTRHDLSSSFLSFQHYGTICLSCPGDREVRPWIFQWDLSLHHVWGAAQRGPNPEAVYWHFPRARDWRTGTRRRPVCQANIPVSLTRDYDQVD